MFRTYKGQDGEHLCLFFDVPVQEKTEVSGFFTASDVSLIGLHTVINDTLLRENLLSDLNTCDKTNHKLFNFSQDSKSLTLCKFVDGIVIKVLKLDKIKEPSQTFIELFDKFNCSVYKTINECQTESQKLKTSIAELEAKLSDLSEKYDNCVSENLETSTRLVLSFNNILNEKKRQICDLEEVLASNENGNKTAKRHTAVLSDGTTSEEEFTDVDRTASGDELFPEVPVLSRKTKHFINNSTNVSISKSTENIPSKKLKLNSETSTQLFTDL